MKITARVQNHENDHRVVLNTNGKTHLLSIAPKSTGFGSSVNGGELLFLALATCYCNDLYREAAKIGIEINGVEVEVEGEFGADGEPARNITYRAKITSPANEETIRALLHQTDRMAEIQNTLRIGAPITLSTDSFPV
ncbi:MAG: OsmC family protein [Anaerolineales bacterium]|jgi:uncharacterized OsmC-like protein